VTYLDPAAGSCIFFVTLFAIAFVISLCKVAKKADEVEPFAVVIHKDAPAPDYTDLEVPAFIRHEAEEFPRERRNRE
jgi:2-keto-4-pentenoate hydratase